jgi:hypothetical protein
MFLECRHRRVNVLGPARGIAAGRCVNDDGVQSSLFFRA